MLKMLSAISPKSGMTRGYLIDRPNDRLPLWLVSVSLTEPENGEHAEAFSSSVVGATGVTRDNAVIRGIGEAVERFALRGTDCSGISSDSTTELPDVTSRLIQGGLLGEDSPKTTFLQGFRVADDQAVRIPQSAIDYPQFGIAGIDSTPSGAASGLTLDSAVLRACVEVIERDAFERAWQGESSAIRLLLEDLSIENDDIEKAVCYLTDIQMRHDYTFALGVMPTITGLPAVTALVSRSSGPIGVGCAAGTSVAACAIKAIVEGVQVESLLRNWSISEYRSDAASDRPRSEIQRLNYLCTEKATKTIKRFGVSFVEGSLPAFSELPRTSGELARELDGFGVETFAADLSFRLPPAVRQLGWKAVRVLPVGLQPLRGDDTLSWNWCRTRISTDTDPGQRRFPHPLA